MQCSKTLVTYLCEANADTLFVETKPYLIHNIYHSIQTEAPLLNFSQVFIITLHTYKQSEPTSCVFGSTSNNLAQKKFLYQFITEKGE
jgi:hypothetical protein